MRHRFSHHVSERSLQLPANIKAKNVVNRKNSTRLLDLTHNCLSEATLAQILRRQMICRTDMYNSSENRHPFAQAAITQKSEFLLLEDFTQSKIHVNHIETHGK